MATKPKAAGPPAPEPESTGETRVDWVWVRVRVAPDISGAGLGSLKPAPETQNYTRLNIKLPNYPYAYIIVI